MGVQFGQEQSTNVVTGTITAANQAGSVFSPVVTQPGVGSQPARFNVSVAGTWTPSPLTSSGVTNYGSATVDLVRSFDGGSTWLYFGNSRTGDTGFYNDRSDVFFETEPGVLYRLQSNGFFVGPVTYRLSQ